MLSKINRLKKTEDFKKIFEKGQLVKGELLDLRMASNQLKICRFGFLISLKVSKKATQRNKIRRQLNEVAGLLLSQIKAGYDLIVIAKAKIIGKNQKQILTDFKNVIRKAQLFI